MTSARALPDWIDSFVFKTEGTGSPLLFRKWAAISTLAGALEQRVWLQTRGYLTFPHLYVFLVGPAGVGKGVILGKMEECWRALPDQFVAPSSVTGASLIDALDDAKVKITHLHPRPMITEYNSMKVLSNELGVFLPAYDGTIINLLTDLWDVKSYEERRRTQSLKRSIPRPQINLIAGTTPAYLNTFLPEGAWDQGFISRTIMIHAGETIFTDPFADPTVDMLPLRTDLSHIVNESFGLMTITEETRGVMTEWLRLGAKPEPEHPKLTSYSSRRFTNVLKLCMISRISRGPGMEIELVDYQRALGWLLEAERYMPDIFTGMTAVGGDSTAINDAWYFVYQSYSKTKQPVLEARVINFLSSRVPSYNIMRVLETMVNSGMMRPQILASGAKGYIPAAKKEF